MTSISWPRVILGGLVAGLVWFLASGVTLALFARDFLRAVQGPHAFPSIGGSLFFVIDLLMGIWAIWLYASIRPRYGSGAKAALVTGVAWWSIKSLQSTKWAGLGFIASDLIFVPLVTTLFATLLAVAIGALAYQVELSPRRSEGA